MPAGFACVESVMLSWSLCLLVLVGVRINILTFTYLCGSKPMVD